MADSKDKVQADAGQNRIKHAFGKIFILLCSVFLLLSLISHNSADLAVLDGGKDAEIQNWIGLIGANLSKFFFYIFGLGAYLIAAYLLISFTVSLFSRTNSRGKWYWISFISFILGVVILFGMHPEDFSTITSKLGIGTLSNPLSSLSGGILGQIFAAPANGDLSAGILRKYLGTVGTEILAVAFILAGTVIVWQSENLKSLFRFVGRFRLKVENTEKEKGKKEDESEREAIWNSIKRKIEERKNRSSAFNDDIEDEIETEPVDQPLPLIEEKKSPVLPSPKMQPINEPAHDSLPKTQPPVKPRAKGKYTLPSVELLKDISETSGDSADIIEKSKEILQDTLNSFQIDAKVTDAVTGPRVTRLEIVPAPGVPLQKINNIESNIKLELQAESMRVLAPIPGKAAVGIEIPNRNGSAVSFKGILNSKQWKKSTYEIPIVLGKSVDGEPIIFDLARAPHLLIAGSTGSGKSVCVNTLIMSLLYKFSPEELRLIMVDPKVVEFEMYQKLPHLITPIVNDPKKVPIALRWSINEMEKRYRLLAKARVRNLAAFNSRPRQEAPILDDEGKPLPEAMPLVIIIIDELADIIMTAKAEVETSIARIAQKARAVGIHLVLATQRPSVQIITGVIKANLPTRIAFRVTSITDSRVILDHKGAESLLGKGDMLFIPPGSAKDERIQGAMVSDAEIESVVSFAAEQAEQCFDMNVITEPKEEDEEAFDEEGEFDDGDFNPASDGDLVQQAIEIIRREKKASTSYLQRRLKIGYNRAAEIIDELEAKGVIGPQVGSSKREILIDSQNNF